MGSGLRVKRLLILSSAALALGACAQIQVNHYLPSGDGELRNRSLCTFGLRDELEMPIGGNMKIRIWGGDPDASALSARVQMLVPEGQGMRFLTNRVTLYTKAATEPTEVFFTGITTACAPEATSCQSRFAPTDWLQGGTVPGSNVLTPTEPKTYRLDVAVPVPPGEAYTLKLPDIEMSGRIRPGPTVRFDKSTTPAATNLSVCQP